MGYNGDRRKWPIREIRRHGKSNEPNSRYDAKTCEVTRRICHRMYRKDVMGLKGMTVFRPKGKGGTGVRFLPAPPNCGRGGENGRRAGLWPLCL